MQQAIPYKSWPTTSHTTNHLNHQRLTLNMSISNVCNNVSDMVSESAVIVLSKRGCCLSHVVKQLLLGLGANPAVYEIGEEEEVAFLEELRKIGGGGGGEMGGGVMLPAVFIGGRLFGGLDRVMATHISGKLVPILKEAGALWL